MKKIKSIVFVLCVMGCSLITTKAVAQDGDTPGFPGGPEGPGEWALALAEAPNQSACVPWNCTMYGCRTPPFRRGSCIWGRQG